MFIMQFENPQQIVQYCEETFIDRPPGEIMEITRRLIAEWRRQWQRIMLPLIPMRLATDDLYCQKFSRRLINNRVHCEEIANTVMWLATLTGEPQIRINHGGHWRLHLRTLVEASITAAIPDLGVWQWGGIVANCKTTEAEIIATLLGDHLRAASAKFVGSEEHQVARSAIIEMATANLKEAISIRD